MNYNFNDVMSKKTDNELITILSARRDEYSDLALDAAQAEFEKREIPFDKIEKVKGEQTFIKQQESIKANAPLEKDIKIIALILPFIARMMYAEKFRKEGYERKLPEMTNASFYGRLIFIALIISIILIFKLIN